MVRVRGAFGRRAALTAAIVLLASIAAMIALTGAAADPRTPEDPAERLVLRLHDLPHGYFPLDFSEGEELEFECEELRPESPGPRLKSFVRRFAPRGCQGFYLRAFRIPGTASAAFVGTGAMDTGSAEGAETGFELAPNLLAKLTEERLEEVPSAQAVGDAARLFHWKHAPTYFRNSRFGSFFVWRSGSVLAVVFASAGSLEASDQIAAELALRQQAHVEHPTPYTRAERYAFEVGLDDPSLTLPVHWLGRNFDPGHGLPPIRLQSGGATTRPYLLPGQKLQLDYSRNVYLNSWTSRGWRRFLATRTSRIMRTWRCTESTRIEIPGGHATVFAAQGRDFEICPDRPPRLFFAFAYLGDTVTAVNFVTAVPVANRSPTAPTTPSAA